MPGSLSGRGRRQPAHYLAGEGGSPHTHLEPLPPRVLPTASGAGPAVLPAELLGRVRAELPMIGELEEREQVLVSAWLTGLRSALTRRDQLASLPGYDPARCGERIAALPPRH